MFERCGDAVYNRALDETIPLGRDQSLEDPLVRLSRLTQEGAPFRVRVRVRVRPTHRPTSR